MDKNELIKALRQEDFPAEQRQQIGWLAEMAEKGGMENLHPALKNWVFETALGPMVKHPFVFTTLAGGLLVDTANQIYAAKIKCRREYLNEKDWANYLWAHERPYRMMALIKLWERGKISADELRECLANVWVDCEMPQRNQDEPVRLFHEAGFTTDDPEGWEKLKSRKWFKLYRGVDYDYELTEDGPSWTFSRKTAEFSPTASTSRATFSVTGQHRTRCLPTTDRGEAEIILDFENLSNPDKIKLEVKT